MTLVNKPIPNKVDKITARQIMDEFALRHGDIASAVQSKQHKIDFDSDLFDRQIDFINDPSKRKAILAGRRCLAKGTLVATPGGPVAIEELKIGDQVIGYNSDGTLSPVEVINTFDQGVIPTVKLKRFKKTVVECSPDHKWLTFDERRPNKLKKTKTSELRSGRLIKRSELRLPLGATDEPLSYTLGAMLGDGCCRDTKRYKTIYISSDDESVVGYIAKQLNATYKKCSKYNFTWAIKSNTASVPHYKEWLYGKYAHEKIADLDIVKTWNRETALKFLAGIIDTDGSVYVSKRRLFLSANMQSRPIIEAVKYLFLALWQYDSTIHEDNRDKYKNGPVCYVVVTDNRVAKRAVKELTPYLQVERKRYKDEYDSFLTNSYSSKGVGVNVVDGDPKHCYDITVDNDTHVFVLSNGYHSANSGKTHGIAYYLIKTCYENSKYITAFIGLTGSSAKEIIWEYISSANERYKLGAIPNLTSNSWAFPNGSMIYVTGADSERDTRKHLGKHYDLVVIDECGDFGPHLEKLVRKILSPTLLDRDGTICMIGTPGDICGGYWHSITTGLNKAWSIHKDWNITHNSRLPVLYKKHNWKEIANKLLERVKEEEGYDDESPRYIRQYLGKWVEGSNSLIYSNFTYDSCTFDKLPKIEGAWNYLMGVDFGVADSSAIVVGAYNKLLKTLYIQEVYKQPGLSPEQMANKINQFYERYQPVAILCDGNGIGAAFLKQLSNMYRLPVQLAEKKDKQAFMELLNDDFRRSRVKIQRNLFEILKEITTFQYKDIELKIVSDTAEDHLLDAMLYMWRSSLHYMGKKEKKNPKIGEVGFSKHLFKIELEAIEKEDDKWWEII